MTDKFRELTVGDIIRMLEEGIVDRTTPIKFSVLEACPADSPDPNQEFACVSLDIHQLAVLKGKCILAHFSPRLTKFLVKLAQGSE